MMMLKVVLAATLAIFTLQACATPAGEGSTIGGQAVPVNLHCEEDEVIGFHGVPDDLACVHIDTFSEVR